MYILPMFFIFFQWSTYETSNLKNYGTDLHQIFTFSRIMERLDNGRIHFVIAQVTLPWQPILDAKWAKLADLPSYYRDGVPKRLEYRNADERIKSTLNWPTLRTNLVRFG